jgi:hypothetical protein
MVLINLNFMSPISLLIVILFYERQIDAIYFNITSECGLYLIFYVSLVLMNSRGYVN